MTYTKEEYLELVNSGVAVGSAVEGYDVGYSAGSKQLAEANKKLAEQQETISELEAALNSAAFTERESFINGKEEGRAEAQARSKVLEDALRKIASFTQSTNLLWWQTLSREALSTTSPAEALDKVVREAVEKQVAGKFCRHCGKEVAKTGHDAFCPVVTGNAIP